MVRRERHRFCSEHPGHVDRRGTVRSTIVCACVSLLLAGCASYAWTKPGAPPDVARRDSEECRAQAWDLVNYSAFAVPYAPYAWWGAAGWGPWGVPWGSPFPDPAWRLDAEDRVYDRCMRYKGYTLVKVPKPQPAAPAMIERPAPPSASPSTAPPPPAGPAPGKPAE